MKKAVLYVILACIFSWALIAIYLLAGGQWGMSPISTVIGMIYMAGPLLAAIIVQKSMAREPLKKLGISFKPNSWWMIALLTPILIAFLSLVFSIALPQVQFSPQMAGLFERYQSLLPPDQYQQMLDQVHSLGPLVIFFITLGQGLIAGVTINALAGFFEEYGWRGLLYNEVRKYGFWTASLITGLVWGFWHMPIILLGHNYPQHPLIGVGMMIIWCTLLSPIFTLVRDRSRSVIACAVMHGTLNAFAGLPIMYTQGGNDLLVGVTGLAGFAVLIIINLFIYLLIQKGNRRPATD